MFQLGTVFRWHNFPDIRDPSSTTNTRWFVYLGRSSSLLIPVFLYICTTTGKVSEYDSGGPRTDNLFIKFRSGECGFDADCVMDVDINFYEDITEDRLVRCMSDIEVINVLP